MRRYLAVAAVAALLSASAFAQQQPLPRTETPAVATPSTPSPAGPVPGANSFTEGQAKSRIESRGYSNVTGLTKDADGIWRGKGMKDGKSVSVSMDFQGNVFDR
jgi:opacity protein-like surface antigen